MRLDLTVEPVYYEAVRTDLVFRRGVIVETSSDATSRNIVALVPLAEMLGYSTAVRIMTSGTVIFTASLAEFRPVAEDLTERLRDKR